MCRGFKSLSHHSNNVQKCVSLLLTHFFLCLYCLPCEGFAIIAGACCFVGIGGNKKATVFWVTDYKSSIICTVRDALKNFPNREAKLHFLLLWSTKIGLDKLLVCLLHKKRLNYVDNLVDCLPTSIF